MQRIFVPSTGDLGYWIQKGYDRRGTGKLRYRWISWADALDPV